jgi:hypothetical protein
MGSKTEMLVAVRAPEGKAGPLAVTLTTDLSTEAFLHWGVRREGAGDWLPAPKEMWPPQSTPVEGNAAALDSPFLPCDDPDTQGIQACSLCLPTSELFCSILQPCSMPSLCRPPSLLLAGDRSTIYHYQQ